MRETIMDEERKHLSETLKFINGIISTAYKKAKYNTNKALSIKSTDHYDNVEKRSFWAKKKSAVEIAEEYEKYVDQPYFGRIDVYDNESKKTTAYYIGDHTILDENYDEVVLAWQSEFGNIFYTNTQKEYTVKNYSYSLELKRRLDVQKSILKGYSDVYNVVDVSLDGDIIDPFLITVLKDKRRQKKLTDIIKTIQSNQNDIIRKPLNETFILQGCAGSGKTMILLHRLSYLIFNNKNLDLSRVKIITPNKLFDEHIDDLSKKLELDRIQKMSVEEYYVELMKSFDSSVKAKADVHSEKALDQDLLEFIYSEDYYDYLEEGYDKYWKNVVSFIDVPKLKQYFRTIGQPFPILENNNFEVYEVLTSGVNKLVENLAKREKSISDLKSTLETYKIEIPKIEIEIQEAKEMLLEAGVQAAEILKDELLKNTALLDEAKSLVEDATIEAGRLSDNLFQLKEAKNSLSETLESALINKSRYIRFDLFSRTSDDISRYIANELSEQIAVLMSAKRDYEKTPFYNFSKRNSLKTKIGTEERSFSTEAEKLLQEYIEQLKGKVSNLEKDINDVGEDNEKILSRLTQYKKSVTDADEIISLLKKCADRFSLDNTPDIKENLSSEEYGKIEKVLPAYIEAFDKHATLNKRHSAMVSSFDTVSKQSDLENELEIKATKEYFKDLTRIIKKLSFNEIHEGFITRELAEHYKNYNQQFTNHNYRHKLMMKLILCSFYYSGGFVKDNFINIDEAQDLSLAEYRLLKRILGKGTVFNLYGDINQLVYQYKGVSDWAELCDILGIKPEKNIYVLNENYRNTIEITEFCNKEFGAEIFPIGISGDPVEIKGLQEAVNWIKRKKSDQADSRCAIIYRYGLVEVQNAISSSFSENQISWYETEENKITVLSVESAKGIEFDYVVAVTANMTENEKYIAYTRALEGLCVVRDEFDKIIEEREDSDSVAYDEKYNSTVEESIVISDNIIVGKSGSMQDVLEQFENYCKSPSAGSGKANSYVCAMRYLCDYLNITKIDDDSVSRIKGLEDNINDKNSALYKDLLAFLSARRQKSYLESGFIRAALKYFFSFYDHRGEVVESIGNAIGNSAENISETESVKGLKQKKVGVQKQPIVPSNDSINISAFENLFSNMSASYKIFWFKGILNLVLQGKQSMTYDEIINQMVAEAWRIVNKDKLSLGYSDKLEKMTSYVFVNSKLSEDAKKEDIIDYLNSAQSVWIYNYKKMIASNVPYRIHAPFLSGFPQNGWSGNSKSIAQRLNKYEGMIYYYKKIDDLDSEIEITNAWYEYFKENINTLYLWVDDTMKDYLNKKNN